MTDRDPDEIRAEARQLLDFFTKAELLVLKTHIAIHRCLTHTIARKRGVDASSLRRISFLAAAKQAHSETINPRLLTSLQLLNDARNIVAHEEGTGEIYQGVRNRPVVHGRRLQQQPCFA